MAANRWRRCEDAAYWFVHAGRNGRCVFAGSHPGDETDGWAEWKSKRKACKESMQFRCVFEWNRRIFGTNILAWKDQFGWKRNRHEDVWIAGHVQKWKDSAFSVWFVWRRNVLCFWWNALAGFKRRSKGAEHRSHWCAASSEWNWANFWSAKNNRNNGDQAWCGNLKCNGSSFDEHEKFGWPSVQREKWKLEKRRFGWVESMHWWRRRSRTFR